MKAWLKNDGVYQTIMNVALLVVFLAALSAGAWPQFKLIAIGVTSIVVLTVVAVYSIVIFRMSEEKHDVKLGSHRDVLKGHDDQRKIFNFHGKHASEHVALTRGQYRNSYGNTNIDVDYYTQKSKIANKVREYASQDIPSLSSSSKNQLDDVVDIGFVRISVHSVEVEFKIKPAKNSANFSIDFIEAELSDDDRASRFYAKNYSSDKTIH